MTGGTFTLPSILYFNTLVLLASSVTLEVSRRRIATFMGGLKSQVQSPARWLYITLFLGLLFVAGAVRAWSQLRAEGLYLATNPSSSFFYLLTAMHALHVLGGLTGLIYVIGKLNKSVSATEHAGCDRALLAFHGRSLDVPASAAVDETVIDSTIRRRREPSGFDHGRTLDRFDGWAGVLDSYKKAGDVVVHHR